MISRCGFARRLSAEHGFTLVELLVVILIIGILLAIAMPLLVNQQDKAKDGATKTRLATAYRTAKAEAASNQGNFPAAGTLVTQISQAQPQLTMGSVATTNVPLTQGTTYLVTGGTNNTDVQFAEQAASGKVWTLTVTNRSKPEISSQDPSTVSYTSTVLADSPAMYWRLGEASGTTAASVVGTGVDGTYTGSPTLGTGGAITGDSNTAISLPVAAGTYVDSSYNPFVNGSTRTYEGWYWVNTIRDYDILMSASTGNSFMLFVQAGGATVAFCANNNAVACTYWVGAMTGKAGAWHHFAVTFNEASNIVELFIDGASKGAQTQTGAYHISPGVFRVGGPGNGFHLQGKADEVAVYNSGLSAARICEHYKVGSGAASC